jgi:hypothetical protein
LIFEPLQEVPDSWHEGYLARLTIEDKHLRFEAIPYMQSKDLPGAQKMDDKSKKQFFAEMEKKSTQVKDGAFLEDQWMKYCLQQKDMYIPWLFAYNKPMLKLRRLLLPLLHSKEERQMALLLVQCETHQEILNTIFRDERSRV